MDEQVQAAIKTLEESGTKYVPERDLIAAKKGLEGQISDLQAQLTNTKAELDTKHTTLLSETAAKEKAEKGVRDTKELQDRIKDLETQLGEATTSRDQLQEMLVVLRRMGISRRAGIDMDELKDKTPEQLDALEEAVKLVKPEGDGNKGSRYDGGAGGGGGGEAPSKGRDLIKAGFKDKGR